MKKNTLILLLPFIFAACADKKAQQKAALDSVIKVHDKVMGEDEQLMKNKMLLDSLAKHNPALKDSAMIYTAKITMADSAMDTWMHQFDPEMTGKTDEQKSTYLSQQKKLIIGIDAQSTTALTASGNYLGKTKTK
jgi:hypothetical protein